MPWAAQFLSEIQKNQEEEKNCHSQVIILIGANCYEFICGQPHLESTLTCDNPKYKEKAGTSKS